MEDEVYKEYILELYRHPLNAGHINDADIAVKQVNQSCGDELLLMVQFNSEGHVQAVAHESKGCAISQAAISLLTEEIKGKIKKELGAIKEKDVLGLLGIPISHTRLHCALLGWKALQKGLCHLSSKK